MPAIGWKWLYSATPTQITRTLMGGAVISLAVLPVKHTSYSACGIVATQCLIAHAHGELTAPAIHQSAQQPLLSRQVKTLP